MNASLHSTQAETWRRLPTSAGSAAAELALGEGLLAGLLSQPQPALRWYEASRPALVLGSGQRPYDEAEIAAATAAAITVHKRGSGGGAVLFWPGFIMQDLVLPTAHPLRRDDVSESYRWLGEVWVMALAQFGIKARLVSISEARADRAALHPLVKRVCYGGQSPYEVLVEGRKLVGLAQTRRRQGCLFQVGLYTHWPGAAITALLRMRPEDRSWLTDALAARVIGLDEIMSHPPTSAALSEAFAVALEAYAGIRLEATVWREDELRAAATAASRFAALNEKWYNQHP